MKGQGEDVLSNAYLFIMRFYCIPGGGGGSEGGNHTAYS